MKRLTYALLIAALSTTMIWQVASADTAERQTAADRERRCRYGSLEGPRHNWSEKEVKLTIRCAAERWPVDLSKVFYIAERESGFFARATNPTSAACGIFQHIPRYWPGRVDKFNQQVRDWDAATGGPGYGCYNARSNVLVSVRAMSQSGYGPWGG